MEIKKRRSSILSPIMIKRFKKFRSLKRGFYSFLIILGVYLLSFFAEFFINGHALFINFEDEMFFTAYSAVDFKKEIFLRTADYRNRFKIAEKYRDADQKVIDGLRDKAKLEKSELEALSFLQEFSPKSFSEKANTRLRSMLKPDLTDKNYDEKGGFKKEIILSIGDKLFEDMEYQIKDLSKTKSDMEYEERLNTLISRKKRAFDRAKSQYDYAREYSGIDDKGLKALEDRYNYYMQIKNMTNNHRKLSKFFKTENNGNSATLAIYPYGPIENLLDELGDRRPPTAPDHEHWLGTDDRGRDVFSRLVYGFRISMSFSLILTLSSYVIGMSIGAIIGYYGGKIDFFAMRTIEIWSAVPFLFTVMIISSIMEPDFTLLIFILTLFSWIGMTWYIRAEFFREKARDYVQAAVAIGVSDKKIIFKHILPNSLTPAISFFPFAIVGGISSLVSLDFLGFGLPDPTPSWGELLGQGVKNLHSWWLTASTVGAMFLTLMLVTFVGEAIREAFDPKVYSRLR